MGIAIFQFQSIKQLIPIHIIFILGELCVEGTKYNEEHESFEDFINVVTTRFRIARVDGRHIHWVRSWKGGDRYSLIFYDTTDRFQTPMIASGVCLTYLDMQ